MNAPVAPHPNDQILHAYGLGKLPHPASSAVDLHLEGCAQCRQRVSELSGDSFVSRLRDAGARPVTPTLDPGPPRPSVGTPKAPASDPALAGELPPELATNDQYTILRELGRGGMGVVYLAHNTMLDRLEVLKVLNKERLDRGGAYERFRGEMRAAARLNHPNVVTAYTALQWGNLLVFAMEHIDGQDLARVVKSRGPVPIARACQFVHDAALGLQHAHERGMVHRDIKPANLMYTRQGKGWTVKILDFGLAKATSEQPVDGSLTRDGQMLGTVDYIAPEQAVDAKRADVRADIYSLGCTLYHLLSGGPPFEGTSLASIVLAHQSKEPRPLNLVRPEVPVELAAVVHKMMAKDPHRRYQAPEEVSKALRPFFITGKAVPGSSDEHRPPSKAGPVPVAVSAGAAPRGAGRSGRRVRAGEGSGSDVGEPDHDPGAGRLAGDENEIGVIWVASPLAIMGNARTCRRCAPGIAYRVRGRAVQVQDSRSAASPESGAPAEASGRIRRTVQRQGLEGLEDAPLVSRELAGRERHSDRLGAPSQREGQPPLYRSGRLQRLPLARRGSHQL